MMKPLRTALPISLLIAVGCAPTQTGAPTATPTPVTTSASPSTAVATPAATPSAVASAVSTYALTGTVLDDSRLPVAGATITAAATGASPVITQTASDGTYKLQVLPATYAVTATKSGYTSRTKNIPVTGPTTVGFGTDVDNGIDANFLSDTPEIQHVDYKEDGPGGPLTMTFTLSEPITAASQSSFNLAFELDSGGTTPFLKALGVSEPYLQTTPTWDTAGKTFTIKYSQPYLASGPNGTVTYTAQLRQQKLDTLDPVTREPQYSDMQIVDSTGKTLGRGRAAYAFLDDPLPNPLSLTLLTDFTYGYYSEERRWNLTHDGNFAFTAATDNVQPQLLSVTALVNQPIGNGNEDLLEMRFNKSMSAVKDAQTLQFTQLTTDGKKSLVVLNVSKNANGSNPTALNVGSPSSIEFSRTDPDLLIFHYPNNLFQDQVWIQVTTQKDMLDPVGNAMDPAHSIVSGAVVGSTSSSEN